MSYAGYLIKILGGGDYIVPLHYVNETSYVSTLPVLDIDSYRDGNGKLHRNAVKQVPKVSITTIPLNNTQVGDLWGNIRARYTNATEKRVTASVYISELDDYMVQSFYVPDVTMTIRQIEQSTNTIKYDPFELKLDGYGD